VITEEVGLKLESAEINMLGKAKTVKIDKDNTTIVGGAGKKSAINERIEEIKMQIEKTTSSYDKEQLQKRLAKLSGGVAVINVGATTETEMKEKKFRVEDTIAATRAALESGVVAGGGLALLEASKVLEAIPSEISEDEKVGFKIVKRSCEEPIRQIADESRKERRRLRCGERRMEKSRRSGYHRSCKGYVFRAHERGVDCGYAFDDRMRDHRYPRAESAAGSTVSGYGRHVLISG